MVDSTQANAIRRDHFMYVPANAGPTERAQVADLVAVTDIVLRRYNPYIKDYKTMMEIFESDGAANAKFCIDPHRAPADAGPRTYNDFETLDEISVVVASFGEEGAPLPSRSVRITKNRILDNTGSAYQVINIPESNRAFDPLHFTLLFPHGDPGWTIALHKRPLIGGPTHMGVKYEAWDPLDGKWRDEDGTAAPSSRQPALPDNLTRSTQLSAAKYYGYRLYARETWTEGLFRARRLFQGPSCTR